MNLPLLCLVRSQANKAVLILPICGSPVGLGANLILVILAIRFIREIFGVNPGKQYSDGTDQRPSSFDKDPPCSLQKLYIVFTSVPIVKSFTPISR